MQAYHSWSVLKQAYSAEHILYFSRILSSFCKTNFVSITMFFVRTIKYHSQVVSSCARGSKLKQFQSIQYRSGAHKGKEHATRMYIWVQCKYKTLGLMVSIHVFGNRTLILTLHDSPWSQIKSDTYKPHSFDKTDMTKQYLQRSMFAFLLVPPEVLRESWIAQEELVLCYPGNVRTSPVFWNSFCTRPHTCTCILPHKSWQR